MPNQSEARKSFEEFSYLRPKKRSNIFYVASGSEVFYNFYARTNGGR